jgi:excisionase family DNA binding protein
MTNSSDIEMIAESKAAKILGVSRTTLLRLRQKGAIRFYKIGVRVLYSAAHIVEFRDAHEHNVAQSERDRALAA